MLHGTPFVLPASLGPLNRADLNDARRPAGCVAYILWPFQLHSTCGGSGIDRHFLEHFQDSLTHENALES